MKRFLIAFALVVFTAVSAFAGSTASKQSVDGRHNPVSDFIPDKTLTNCLTIPAGRAKSVSVDVSSTYHYSFNSYVGVSATSPGTAEIVKRSWDSNTAYMPLASETKGVVPANAATLVFTGFSSGSVRTICYEKDK